PSGTVITTSPIALTCPTAASEYDSIVRPPIFTNALGAPDPSRVPIPAATMIAEAVTLRPCPRNLPRAGLFAFAFSLFHCFTLSLFRHPSEIRTPNLRLQQNRRPLRQK